jgi:long-chain acyl-CoA synthetase
MQTIITALAERVRARPTSIALIWGDVPVDTVRFDAMTTAGAAALLDAGVVPGDRVLLHLPNSRKLALAYYAAFKAGATAVPVPAGASPGEIRYIVGSCHPRLGLRCATDAAAPQPGLQWLTLENHWPAASAPRNLPAIAIDSPAVILYTSGTTGQAKGVTHTHRSLRALLEVYRRAPGTEMAAVISLPIVHSYAFFTFVSTISTGGTAILLEHPDAEKILDAIDRHSAGMAIASPKMAHELIAAQLRSPRRLNALSHINISGDLVPLGLQQRFMAVFGPRMRRTYGSSEMGPITGEPAGTIAGSAVGLPFRGVDLHILDEHGHDVPAGQVGEIVVRSPWMASGYWGNHAETTAAFRNGYLHTGDLGFLDATMRLHFAGRKKEIIVRGAHKVPPVQLEEILRSHPAVEDAAVWGIPDPILGQVVGAWVIAKAPVSVEELREFVRPQVATHKCPEQIFFVATFPRTAAGKLQRRMLAPPAA